MRGARYLLLFLAALAVGACARQQQTYYVIDPATGQPVPVVAQQPYAQPQYAEQSYGQPAPQAYQQPAAQPAPSGGRGLFSSSPAFAQQSYAQQPYTQPSYQPPVQQPVPQAAPSGRGLFNSRSSAPQAYVPPPVQQPYMLQYRPPQYAAPQYAAPQYAPQYATPQYAAPNSYAALPSSYDQAYTLDSGDKLRVVVFGQDGITNSYTVDAGGNINLPLVGTVPARGYSTQQLSKMITDRLKQGYVREPHVSVEVEAYRPFFILGEVTNPGQYPYVANMTAETAVAIAGGFAPRANKSKVELTRNAPGQQMKGDVPLGFALRPGDTIVVKERWF
jgi:polysaccharide export outer membrane protein